MGVSQILHMYITSLINIALKHNEYEKHENQYMLKSSISKACKRNRELEIVTKTNRENFKDSKPWWSSHQTSLKVMHLM